MSRVDTGSYDMVLEIMFQALESPIGLLLRAQDIYNITSICSRCRREHPELKDLMAQQVSWPEGNLLIYRKALRPKE